MMEQATVRRGFGKQLARLFGLALGGMVLGLSLPAMAAETVILQGGGTRFPLPFDELEAFVETGEKSDDLEVFLAQAFPADERLREILSRKIPDTGKLLGPNDLRFIAIRMNRYMGEPLGRPDVDLLVETLQEGFADDRVLTILEILKNYDGDVIRVDLARLDIAARDFERFVSRIEPVLAILDEVLHELVCDCELVAAPATGDPVAAATTAEVKSPGCPAPLAVVANKALYPGDRKDGTLVEIAAVPGARPPISQHVLDEWLHVDPEVISSGMFDRFLEAFLNGPLPGSNRPELLSDNPEASLSSAWQALDDLPGGQVVRYQVVRNGVLSVDFGIKELTTLAETGAYPSTWSFYFNIANIPPERLQAFLNEELKIADLTTLYGRLNSFLGEYLLFQVGRIVRTPTGNTSIQTLRSAMMRSALDDNRITVIEILQNWPVPVVIIEGANLTRITRNISEQGTVRAATSGLEETLLEVRGDIADDICDCPVEEN